MPSAYILVCADSTLYSGSTADMDKRLHAHNHTKAAAKYTRSRRPVTLGYHEEFDTLAEAQAREREFKKLSRQEKLRLIERKE